MIPGYNGLALVLAWASHVEVTLLASALTTRYSRRVVAPELTTYTFYPRVLVGPRGCIAGIAT